LDGSFFYLLFLVTYTVNPIWRWARNNDCLGDSRPQRKTEGYACRSLVLPWGGTRETLFRPTQDKSQWKVI